MKKVTITFLLLVFNLGFSQVETPFFEQIAFDFYKDSILEKFPSKKKIRIAKYASDFHPNYDSFQLDKCLTREFLEEQIDLEILSSYSEKETDFDFYSRLMDYDGINKKQFRIKRSKTHSYPFLRISKPYHKKDGLEMFFVAISENHKKKNIMYYLQIDNNGMVKKWCRNVKKIAEVITIY